MTGCCEHCPGDFDNVVTKTDLEDLRSTMQDKIEDLERDVQNLRDHNPDIWGV
jgi:hypothetical protein